MKYLTHVLGGVALTSAASLAAPTLLGPATPTALAVGVVGSLLPDIDHPKSTIANLTLFSKVLSKSVSMTTGHRGLCHSFAFIFVISILFHHFAVGLYQQITPFCTLWLALGMLSHLLLDMLNPTGVKLFWPVGKKRHLIGMKTGGLGEQIVAVILMALDTYLLTLLF